MAVYAWDGTSDKSLQDVITCEGTDDPPRAYFKVQTINGSALQIRKTSDDGNVSDIYFLVSGNGVVGGTKLYCTDANGYINATDLPTNTELTVKEMGYKNADGSYSLPSYYDTPIVQKVILEPNTTATVTFHNSRNDEELTIRKTAEDGNIANIAFEVDDLTLGERLGIFTTDNAGVINVPNSKLAYNHTYKIVELGTIKTGATVGSQNPTDYEIPAIYAEQPAKTITLTPPTEDETQADFAKRCTVSFHNTLINGKIQVVKSIERLDNTSSADLSGFEFRVYGTSVNGIAYDKTFTTDANGYIEIPKLLVGTYTVEEVANSKTVGYILPEEQEVVFVENTALTFLNVEKPEQTETEPEPEDVDTGDNNDYSTFAFITLLSLLACVVLFKKKSNNEN